MRYTVYAYQGIPNGNWGVGQFDPASNPGLQCIGKGSFQTANDLCQQMTGVFTNTMVPLVVAILDSYDKSDKHITNLQDLESWRFLTAGKEALQNGHLGGPEYGQKGYFTPQKIVPPQPVDPYKPWMPAKDATIKIGDIEYKVAKTYNEQYGQLNNSMATGIYQPLAGKDLAPKGFYDVKPPEDWIVGTTIPEPKRKKKRHIVCECEACIKEKEEPPSGPGEFLKLTRKVDIT